MQRLGALRQLATMAHRAAAGSRQPSSTYMRHRCLAHRRAWYGQSQGLSTTSAVFSNDDKDDKNTPADEDDEEEEEYNDDNDTPLSDESRKALESHIHGKVGRWHGA